MASKRVVLPVGLALAAIVTYVVVTWQPKSLVLTGIVTTNDVIVSSQVPGQVGQLLVKEGDSVSSNQLVAVINPDELRADAAYYAHSAEGAASASREGASALQYEQQQEEFQVRQAEAVLAATESQRAEAAADLDNAQRTFVRDSVLQGSGGLSVQDLDQARTAYQVAQARVSALDHQLNAQRAAVALAKSTTQQVAMRQNALVTARQQQAAAGAQRAKAAVRLGYTELHAPIAGIVDVRAARAGEVVTAGQPVITLINPDDLWVRADVEETYIDRVRIGDSLTVRLPSGQERRGAVFFRGVDAGFATQRDVSRTKRDIKTFEIRIRLDNRDRRLALGMTAYVLLPVTPPPAVHS